MAKFSGAVGYAHSEETAPGVYEDIVTEHSYLGDVVRNTRRLREGDLVNNDISVSNSISIVADKYAYGNIFAMKYIRWMGVLWIISEIEVQSPRLILRLGVSIMDRLQLQSLLEDILGSTNVYFQQPSNVEMHFPAIVYRRDNARTEYADNNPYSNRIRYQVTVIDRNPDSLIPNKVAALPLCIFNRFYVVDKLNHDVYNLYI